MAERDDAGFHVEFDRPVTREVAAKRIFLAGSVPTDWTLRPEGASLTSLAVLAVAGVSWGVARWRVDLPTGTASYRWRERVAPAIRRPIEAQYTRAGLVDLGGVRVLAGRTASRQQLERERRDYLDTTVPSLGLTRRQILSWGQGWYEKNGYFIYVGATEDREYGIEYMHLLKDKQLNEEIRWYLGKGASLGKARRLLIAQWGNAARQLIVGYVGAFVGDDWFVQVITEQAESSRVEAEIAALAGETNAPSAELLEQELADDARALLYKLREAAKSYRSGGR